VFCAGPPAAFIATPELDRYNAAPSLVQSGEASGVPMYNLLISLAAALVTFVLFHSSHGLNLVWYSALVPALIVLGVVYFLLARRTMKQLEAVMGSAQKDFLAQRWDAGIAKMQEAFALSQWQFLIASQVHAQLGSVLYMLKRFDEAKPHLEKSFVRIGQARAMLGALHYMDKDYEKMTKTFEDALPYNKKDGMLWSIYAWCLDKSGQREKALEAIGRGLEESPSDEKMKANQLALQNKERMRMKAYGQEWWAFHLEQPPTDFVPAHMRGQLQQARPGYRTFSKKSQKKQRT
jgi:tetratricopeptide (TPR) repeat protein